MPATNHDPFPALLEQLLLGKLPPDEVERLCVEYADDQRLAALAEQIGPGDPLLDTVRAHATTPESRTDPRVERLIARLLVSVPPAVTPAPEQALTNLGKTADWPSDAPQQFDQFRVVSVLGEGGMGTVYLALDTRLDRQVALKTMRPELAANEGARERFFREARCAAAIEHENIIPIYHVSEADGVPFLAMPLLKGEGLDKRLSRQKGIPLPLEEIVAIGRQMSEGLAAAHDRGLVHRDVKPGNVWLEDRGPGRPARVRILDFGLARPIADDAHLTRSGAIVGTPAYMAPEQARGETVDHRADLFSLGCVLYHLATGHQPFTGNSVLAVLTSLVADEHAAPEDRNPALPPELSDLIDWLLEKDPNERPATTHEVARELANLKWEPPAPPPLVVPHVSPQRTRDRRWVPAALGVALIVLFAAAAGQWVIIRDKDGNVVAQVLVPAGGSVEIKPVKGATGKTSESPASNEVPPLAQWLKGREVLTVSQDGKGQFKTIQAALNALKPGQVVKVLDKGPYRERIEATLPDNVGLVSEAGTIVDIPDWSRWVAPDQKARHYWAGVIGVTNGVRLSGITFIAPALPTDATAINVLQITPGGDVVVESCRFYPRERLSVVPPPNGADFPSSAPPCLLLLTQPPAGKSARVHFVENDFEGRIYCYDKIASLRFERNRMFSRWQGESLLLATEDVIVRHNVLVGEKWVLNVRMTKPDPNGTPTPQTTVITNNTIDSVGEAIIFFHHDGSTLPTRVVIRNNLLRSRNGAGVHVPAADLAQARKVWEVGHNAYLKEPGPGESTFPRQPSDLTLENQFLSVDPRNHDYFRVATDSKLATGGAGGDLPKYIGALPPGPAPKDGDWFTRLREVAHVPFAWPAEALREGRITAPDLSKAKRLLEETFADPEKSVVGKEMRMPSFDRVYEDGRFVMRYKWEKPGAFAAAKAFDSPKSAAFQVVARAKGDKRDGWGVILIDPADESSGVGIRLSRDGLLTFEGTFRAVQKFPGTRPEPVRHAAVKTGDDDNTLLLVLRGRELEVYVNGVAVCQPILLDREFAPVRLLLTAYPHQKGATAEFKSVAVWSADEIPTPQERAKK